MVAVNKTEAKAGAAKAASPKVVKVQPGKTSAVKAGHNK